MYVSSPNQKKKIIIIKETEKKTRTPVLKSLKNNTGVVRIVDRFYYSKVIHSFEINTIKTHKIKAELIK